MAKTSPFEFVQQVRRETSKVTWPTRKETGVTTMMVFVMVAFASVFFAVVDIVLQFGIGFYLAQADRVQNMVMRWYIVHTYSNFEKKVADSIKEQAETQGLADRFEEILVPTEEVVEMRRGRKIQSERKFFPGYVLVKMELSDETYHLIRNTGKVTGFLGSGNRPSPVPDVEVARIMNQVQEGIERPKPVISFEIGEQVRVCDGPFASFNGVVEEVDTDRTRLKVAVSIFGRATPVELEFGQVEKV